MEKKKLNITLGDQELEFETGRIARQADGAVLVRCGETIVFASACASPTPLEDVDFLPLRVDYQETFSSAGKTLGGFMKRQGRPSEKETLVCRLIDRPLRPLFENGWYHDTQILSYVWSYDGQHAPEPLAICAASAALTLSSIPLVKPIAAVRVGQIDGKFVINPTIQQQKESKLDLLMAGTEDAILMIEGFCDFLTEEEVMDALNQGQQAIQTIAKSLAQWQKEIGKKKNRETLSFPAKETVDQVADIVTKPLQKAVRLHDKQEREEAFATIKNELKETLLPPGKESAHKKLDVDKAFKSISQQLMRDMVLKEKIRCDGRTTTEIRPISIEPSLLPRTHGSALFTRGETQSVATCTLGGDTIGQRYEDLEEEGVRRFYLHYFFPPYSVGEVGRVGVGRREIGHGKLAERALSAVVPPKSVFPYSIRVESNITESNGSSSMASVCGGCLAMMDAGVPIQRPVAGIAMGLLLQGDDYMILSDILGIEDALGDMDFKITGDDKGITAFQMDIKIEGITPDIMRAALLQAREGRIHILEKMLAVLPKSRKEMSAHAPRIETVQIRPSKIAAVIGPGGKQIRSIIEETGVDINIDDSGLISLASSSLESIERAKARIQSLTAEVEIGAIYQGIVKSIVPFGLFIEILPDKTGLCHISEFDVVRIDNLEDCVKVGDELSIKVIDINERGQIKLSRKAILLKSAQNAQS